MNECRQVWNRDRAENTWHFHYECQVPECPSPHCETIRSYGFETAYEYRADQRLTDAERVILAVRAALTAASNRADMHRQSSGYALGAPDGRTRLVLDDVIEDAISALPMPTRLYPEVFAHRITDMLLPHLLKQLEQATGTPLTIAGNTLRKGA